MFESKKQKSSVLDRLPEPLKKFLRAVKQHLIDPLKKALSTGSGKFALVYLLLLVAFIGLTLTGAFRTKPQMKPVQINVSSWVTPHQLDNLISTDADKVDEVVVIRGTTTVFAYRKGDYTGAIACVYNDDPLNPRNALMSALADRVARAKIRLQTNNPEYDMGFFATLSGFWYVLAILLVSAGFVYGVIVYRRYSDRKDEEYLAAQKDMRDALKGVMSGSTGASSSSHVMADSLRRKFTDLAQGLVQHLASRHSQRHLAHRSGRLR